MQIRASLRGGRQKIHGLLDDLLEIKDVASLYELWCYFRVVEAIKARLGQPRRALSPRHSEYQTSLHYGLSVEWPNGVQALYNATFSSGTGAGARSYSVRLRPDITVVVPQGSAQGIYILDAKFSLQRLNTDAPDDDDDHGESSKYTNRDIHKMHTYRDSLRIETEFGSLRTRAAVVLYPGTSRRFFSIDDRDEELDGVGAIPLQPGTIEQTALNTWLTTFISR